MTGRPAFAITRRALAAAFLSALAAWPASAQTPQRTPANDPVATSFATPPPIPALVRAKNGIVASQEALATRIGVEILERGGNAVDAAVAVGFALAVTLPRAGNLGGGGFFVIWLAERQQAVTLDFREIAPAAIRADSFLGPDGRPDPRKSLFSGLAVGVPGSVAGLAHALAQYGSGKFTLAQLIEPAERLAREGIPVVDDLAISLRQFERLLSPWEATTRIFFRDGKPLGENETLRQPDLADTLRTIAARGPDGFYRGEVAEKIVAAVRAAGGVMTMEDLAAYRVETRSPVRGRYRGFDVISMPPPSAGGALLVQMLNVLEPFDLEKWGRESPDTIHVMIEAMKRAYADRAEYFGDPAFVKIPLERLISKAHAEKQRASILFAKTTPSATIRAGDAARPKGDNTTHYSVVDRFGNAVAATVTLNFSYGMGMVAGGTGVLLNNELDDFAAASGVPNAYGLVGGDANAPGPGKRPLSSMTPTILLKDGKAVLVTGSPGGSRIITTVLRVITGVIDHKLDIAEAIAQPRFHHQWLPDQVRTEPGLPPALIEALKARGHDVSVGPNSGGANSILVTPEGLTAAADARYLGALAAGH
jgi:gamma-glutamyltranspeptidase/glutathione hydrolase